MLQIDYATADAGACEPGNARANTSDEDLIRIVAGLDKRALHILWSRHNLRVYRFVFRLIQNKALAEDVVSEVFLEVWRHADLFQAKSKVSTWLLAIARNKAMVAVRRWRWEETEEKATIIADLADDPERVIQKKSDGAVLQRFIMKLSFRHKEVIDLVYYHEKSITEVAEIIDASVNTVKTRMFYARRHLAKLLAHEGICTTRS
jgi:RNA polymerase sigma-70 factor (ECF subfamily)